MCLNKRDNTEEFRTRQRISERRNRQIRSAELFLLLQYLINSSARHGTIPGRNYSVVVTYNRHRQRALTLVLNYETPGPDLAIQNPLNSPNSMEFSFTGREPLIPYFRERSH